jgi:NhaP-type Na+/H+ or K+/H+ antiporter
MENTIGPPTMAHLPYIMGIAIGLSVIAFSSIGISNAKKRKGGSYNLQVIGLVLAILWTLYFLWRMGEVSGSIKYATNWAQRKMTA